jgi:hemerythrin superfamily protein
MATRQKARRTHADALGLLQTEHQQLRELFQHYTNTTTPQGKHQIAAHLCNALDLHMDVEELVFYPAMARATDEEGEQLVAAARWDHQTITYLMTELEAADDTEEFDARFHTLMATVQRHLRAEEIRLFPKAAEHLEKRLEDLRDEMVELKQQLTASARE